MRAVSSIAEALVRVRERIASAAARAGRKAADVRLLAVTKTHPPEVVREAYGAGHRDFGESYVQELVRKHSALADLDGIRWHLIGHLQRNKVPPALEAATTIQSVDSVRLVETLGKRASRPVEILVEVNVGGEAQKAGVAPEDLADVLAAAAGHPNLVVRGLMTVPPFSDDPEESRPHFRALRETRDAHGGPDLLPELSMGMTTDLEVAVEEGATWVRVGTAIFGERSRR